MVFDTTWISAESCNADNAIPAEIEQLVEDPGEWDGKCVSVTGHQGFRALFTIAADSGRIDAMWARDLEGQRIGLYGRNNVVWLPRGDVDGTSVAIGQVGYCEHLYVHYFMVRGYCHGATGPYLALSTPQTTGARVPELDADGNITNDARVMQIRPAPADRDGPQ